MQKLLGQVALYLDRHQTAVMERYAKEEGISFDAACMVATLIGVDAIGQEQEKKRKGAKR